MQPNYSTELARLREERGRAVKEMRDIHEKAEKENRGFNADEQQTWANADTKVQELEARIARTEKLSRESEPEALRAALNPPAGSDGAPKAKAHADAFRSFLRFGMQGLNDEQRALIQQTMTSLAPELRAFSAGTGNTGGYTVPQDFYNKLEVALKYYGPMLDESVVNILRTDTGATLPMPTMNDTATSGEQLGENAQAATDTSTPFGVINLGAYIYSSKVIPVSLAFLQDSAFTEDFLINLIAERLGRIMNQRFTTGTGSSQPNGIVTAAASGKVGTTGQTLTVIYDDLVDLVHSIDPAYRNMGCAFMMNDSSMKVVRKIKDGQSRPIFLPGYDANGPMPDTLLGYGVKINNDVAAMAANAKSILFGLMKKYHVRLAKDVTVLRLTERYADYLQVGFLGFARADGNLLDAGTNPVKYYQNSAT